MSNFCKRDYFNYHDYYSKTYPRYQGYSERENKSDLIDLINVIYDNKKRELEYEIYETPEGDINPKFSYNVNRVLSNEITGDLSVPVIQAITMVLSSPNASVALEAPVVALMGGSVNLRASTVNLMAQALSTDIMYDPMVNAVSETMKSEQVTQALKEPVAEIIPSEEISGVVSETASRGIRVDKIIGNNGENFTDKNKNGIPDEYEELSDIQQTIIWGGLGA